VGQRVVGEKDSVSCRPLGSEERARTDPYGTDPPIPARLVTVTILEDAHESSTRAWLARRREGHELFTVTRKGRTLIPALQLDERGEPREDLHAMLSTLVPAGILGWSLPRWRGRTPRKPSSCSEACGTRVVERPGRWRPRA
jgi:hypothetical protein